MTAAESAGQRPKRERFFGFEFPDFSVLKDGRVQTLIYSRNVQKLGIATLSYGASIYLAESGASQIQVSLIAVTGFVAALMFGFQGGIVVDRVAKRTALAGGYALMAALCFVVPWLFGTDVIDLVFLAFLVAVLATVTGPALKAAVVLVATPAALATVAAVLNLLGSMGSAIGQAFVAPLLMSISGIDACMYGAGIILLTGAVWSLRIPEEPGRTSAAEAIRDINWKPRALDLAGTARWLVAHRGVATIMLVGSTVTALGETVGSLMPVYVRDVLDTSPAYSIYVFAPAGLGYLAGSITAPWLIGRFGARRTGVSAFVVSAMGVVLFGLIEQVAPILAPVSPTRLLELFGADLNDKMLAAGFIAMPANFGSTATASAVQNFVNARVPLAQQGATFGMGEVLDNSLTIVTMLALGATATWLGPRFVFVVAPVVTFSIVVWLIRYSLRAAGMPVPERRDTVEEFWEGPEDEPA